MDHHPALCNMAEGRTISDDLYDTIQYFRKVHGLTPSAASRFKNQLQTLRKTQSRSREAVQPGQKRGRKRVLDEDDMNASDCSNLRWQ